MTKLKSSISDPPLDEEYATVKSCSSSPSKEGDSLTESRRVWFSFSRRKKTCWGCKRVTPIGNTATCSGCRKRFCSNCFDEELCQKCFIKPEISIPRSPSLGSEEQQNASNPLRDLRIYDVSMPRWVYLLKPISERANAVPIGSLSVRIMEAKDLPALDRNGLSDPYCKVLFNEEQCKTKTIKKSLDPVWNQKKPFIFPVLSVMDYLEVQLFDYDMGSSADDYMGSVYLSVKEIAQMTQKIVRKGRRLSTVEAQTFWFDVKLHESVVFPLVKKKKPIPQSRVKVELAYQFSRIGELCSYLRDDPKPIKPKIDEKAAKAMRFRFILQILAVIEILRDYSPIIGDLFKWTSWINSVLFTIFVCLIIIYPFLFWTFSMALLLYVLITSFMSTRLEKLNIQSQQFVLQRDTASPTLEKLHNVGFTEEEMEQFENGDSDQFYTVVKRIFAMMKESKRRRNEKMPEQTPDPGETAIVKLVLLIKNIDNLIVWKEPKKSFKLVFGIFLSLCYSIYFDTRWPVLAAALFVLTKQAPPLVFLSRIVFGSLRYLTAMKSRFSARRLKTKEE